MDAKERIIEQLKRSGCRVTKQRLMLIDVILEGKCNCCKEIYYQASLKDPSLGPATVYRMVNTLEQIGAISRKNMYRISDEAIRWNAWSNWRMERFLIFRKINGQQ